MKKLLIILLLSTMLPAGAFATAGPSPRPRLAHFSPAVEAQSITSKDKAIACAKALLLRDEMGIASLRDDLVWEVIDSAESPDKYIIAAGPPDDERGLYSAAFHQDGRVCSLGNFDFTVDNNTLPVNVTVGKAEQEALAGDLVRFMRLINLEEAEKANHWTCQQMQGLASTHLYFTFYDWEADQRINAAPSATITVEIAPTVWILQINFKNPAPGKSG